jgi:hypothetical protein
MFFEKNKLQFIIGVGTLLRGHSNNTCHFFATFLPQFCHFFAPHITSHIKNKWFYDLIDIMTLGGRSYQVFCDDDTEAASVKP